MFYMSAGLGPPVPPFIIAAACFIRSGFCIIYWTIGLFIISAMFPIPLGIAGIPVGEVDFTSSYYEGELYGALEFGNPPAFGT